jgi:hypothetical protein
LSALAGEALVQFFRWFPSILQVLAIVRPETLIRWHRAGFCRYWRWKSRSRGRRPALAADLRALIRQMSIHGELLKLGFEVAQSTVARYMVKRWKPSRMAEFLSPLNRQQVV